METKDKIDKQFLAKKGFFQLSTKDSWGAVQTIIKDWKFETFDLAHEEMMKQLIKGFLEHITGFARGRYTCVAYICDDKEIIKQMDIQDLYAMTNAKNNY